MDDKDIEQQLKESVQKIEMKDFSVRMEAIQGRLRTDEAGSVKEKELVLAAEGANEVHISNRKNLLFFVGGALLICAVFLAILLPLTLRNNTNFYNVIELSEKQVASEEFYSEIDKTDIAIPNLSYWQVNSCALMISPEQDVRGCRVTIAEEDKVYITIYIYDSSILITSIADDSFSNFECNNVIIQYQTEKGEIFDRTTAYATDGKTKYVLDCISVEENVATVFEKLFG